MKDLNGLRVIQACAAVLAVVMGVLVKTSTHRDGAFTVWLVLALVGCGAFLVARFVDERERRERRRRELERRMDESGG